jgi:hypothetical protein
MAFDTSGELEWCQEFAFLASKAPLLCRNFGLRYLRAYFKQGQYVKAEPLYERALATREKALGPKQPRRGDIPGELRNPITEHRPSGGRSAA